MEIILSTDPDYLLENIEHGYSDISTQSDSSSDTEETSIAVRVHTHPQHSSSHDYNTLHCDNIMFSNNSGVNKMKNADGKRTSKIYNLGNTLIEFFDNLLLEVS